MTPLERECINTVRVSNRKLNCVRFSNGETKKHVNAKIELCLALQNANKQYITEAIFEKGGRADIINLTDGEIYEILVSETEEQLKRKFFKYPKLLKIIPLKADKVKRWITTQEWNSTQQYI